MILLSIIIGMLYPVLLEQNYNENESSESARFCMDRSPFIENDSRDFLKHDTEGRPSEI